MYWKHMPPVEETAGNGTRDHALRRSATRRKQRENRGTPGEEETCHARTHRYFICMRAYERDQAGMEIRNALVSASIVMEHS